ncbi:MAG: response regulator [Spirochaetales bacterium]|nr:MAG: response regulator [Spirochaetales bacterium]
MDTSTPAPDDSQQALIVEDNQINRIVASQMLRRAGITSVQASGAMEALELMRGRTFGIVLMDIQMPGMDGLEATRQIRGGAGGELNRSIPIIAMTAYSSVEDEEACYHAGMNAYLCKPLALQRFIDVVKGFMTPDDTPGKA